MTSPNGRQPPTGDTRLPSNVMTETTVYTREQLTDTALIVTTVNGRSGLKEQVAADAAAAGCTPPPIIVVDHPSHFQVITVAELAATGILAVIVPGGPDETDTDMIGLLGETIQARCEQLGIRAPLLMTVTEPGAIEQWATSRGEAEKIVGFLNERFGL